MGGAQLNGSAEAGQALCVGGIRASWRLDCVTLLITIPFPRQIVGRCFRPKKKNSYLPRQDRLFGLIRDHACLAAYVTAARDNT